MKRFTLLGVVAAVLVATLAPATRWWRTFGGTETDIGYCVQQTSDGGYIVSGYTGSFSGMWLLKLDSLGHEEWSKTYGNSDAFSVRETSDGGYITVGHQIIKTDENGNTVWTRNYGAVARCIQITEDENFVVTGEKSNSLWLMKISAVGDSLWARTYMIGNAGNTGHYVEQTSDNGYIITGVWVEEDPEIQDWKTGLWLLKADVNGDTLWTRSYGGDDWGQSDRGNCVRQTETGDYIIAGHLNNYSLIKTDYHGDTLWCKIRSGEGHCVEQTSDSGFILVGGTKSGTLLSEPMGGNLWLVKMDANGDTVWTREYGGEETDAGRYVQQTTDTGYIVVGYTHSFGSGGGDLYLLKTDSLGLLGIVEEPLVEEEQDWKVLIPIGSSIVLQYRNMSHGFKASVFDVTGRKVDQIRGDGNEGAMTWGINQPPGVYFIQALDNRGELKEVKVEIIR